MRHKKHADYSLYRKKVRGGFYWYVRFWSEQDRRYSQVRATGVEVTGKKGRRAEAQAVAEKMLPSVIAPPPASSSGFLDFLAAFWQSDSAYFRAGEKFGNRRCSAGYIGINAGIVKKHIAAYPPFAAIGPAGLNKGMIDDFMLFLSERGVSNSHIARALQVMRVPVRWLFGRGEIPADPFAKVKTPVFASKEKGCLTKSEVAALIAAPAQDGRKRLAVLLGALCGLRLGEVRALRREDLSGGNVDVRRNWQNLEGEKQPKFGSFRKVPLPPEIAALKTGDSGLIFGRGGGPKPMSASYFSDALAGELKAIGISAEEQRMRNLSFHSLRHTFVSLAFLAGLTPAEVMAMSGHKNIQTFKRYLHPGQVVEIGKCGDKMAAFRAA